MSACSNKSAWLCVLVLACTKDPPAERDAAAMTSEGTFDASSLGSFTFIDAEPSVAVADAAPPPELDLAPYLVAKPTSVKSIGHTSVVLKVELSGGLTAAFKPESKRGHSRYRGEIAAYRLGRALGLRNVPPAIGRTFDATALKAAATKNAKALSLYDDEVVAHAGYVRGALMPWIASLEFLPIETDPWRVKWTKWLAADQEMPVTDKDLAAQISTLVVFDTITGNWDRWSGANVGIDKATNTLLFVDNDGAFFEPAPAAPLAAQLARLAKVDRYSLRFIAAVRALEPIALSDAIGEEVPGTPLLGPKTLASADERRRRVLAIIDEKIAKLGFATVFAFD